MQPNTPIVRIMIQGSGFFLVWLGLIKRCGFVPLNCLPVWRTIALLAAGLHDVGYHDQPTWPPRHRLALVLRLDTGIANTKGFGQIIGAEGLDHGCDSLLYSTGSSSDSGSYTSGSCKLVSRMPRQLLEEEQGRFRSMQSGPLGASSGSEKRRVLQFQR